VDNRKIINRENEGCRPDEVWRTLSRLLARPTFLDRGKEWRSGALVLAVLDEVVDDRGVGEG